MRDSLILFMVLWSTITATSPAQSAADEAAAKGAFLSAQVNAVGVMQTFAGSHSEDPFAHYYLGLALQESRRLAEADRSFQRTLDHGSATSRIFAVRGMNAVMSFDSERAAFWYRRMESASEGADRSAAREASERHERIVADLALARAIQMRTASAIVVIALAAFYCVRRSLRSDPSAI